MTGVARNAGNIPLAPGWPVIGNLPEMMSRPIDFLSEQYGSLGSVFRVNVATKTYTVLAGAEANLLMSGACRDRFSSRETWGRFVEKMDCPHLLIGSDGESHAYQRKLLKPFFARGNFRERYHCLVEVAKRRLDAVPNRTIRVAPFLRHLICEQSGLILQDLAVDPDQSEAFINAQNTTLNVYMVGKWPRLAMLHPRYLYAQYKTNRFSNALWRAHLEKPEQSRETYLDKVSHGRADRPEWFTDGDIHAHIMLPFIGGVDPAGGAMSFLMYELLTQPALAQRIRQEVDSFCEEGFPDFDMLDEMEDLQGFIYEVLRLHPTGFVLSRTASQDISFNGYRIPKGSELLVFNSADHFNEKYFPSPRQFDIERYREPRMEHKARAVFAPFGRGPHTCVGNALAELMLKVNTIVLLRHYNMALKTPLHKLRTEYIPGPFMSKNFRIQLQPRRPSEVVVG